MPSRSFLTANSKYLHRLGPIPQFVGRDQVVEIRTRNGRLYLVRRAKIREPENWNDEEQTNGVGSSDDIAEFCEQTAFEH